MRPAPTVPHNRLVSDHVGNPASDPDFPTATWGREGYCASEVDEFVTRLERSLAESSPGLSSQAVVETRFTVSRRGRRYALRAVDEYLDSGRQRLRQRAGDDAEPDVEAPHHRHFQTRWIYLVALVLVAAMVLFVLTKL